MKIVEWFKRKFDNFLIAVYFFKNYTKFQVCMLACFIAKIENPSIWDVDTISDCVKVALDENIPLGITKFDRDDAREALKMFDVLELKTSINGLKFCNSVNNMSKIKLFFMFMV